MAKRNLRYWVKGLKKLAINQGRTVRNGMGIPSHHFPSKQL